MAFKTFSELEKHTAVCAQRQGDLQALVSLIVKVLFGVAGFMFVSMVTTIANLILHFPPAH